NNLTQYLALELAPHRIRVNAIAPGFFPAEQNRKLLSEDRMRAILAHTPARRLGEPQELIGTVNWLASEAASAFVTGASVGSHGGATADGQLEVLASLGMTQDRLGCEIRASMDTVRLGEVDGVPVYIDRVALEQADAIIPINRVKPHTDFSGPVESGLLKMI